jgi:hypothetical protein
MRRARRPGPAASRRRRLPLQWGRSPSFTLPDTNHAHLGRCRRLPRRHQGHALSRGRTPAAQCHAGGQPAHARAGLALHPRTAGAGRRRCGRRRDRRAGQSWRHCRDRRHSAGGAGTRQGRIAAEPARRVVHQRHHRPAADDARIHGRAARQRRRYRRAGRLQPGRQPQFRQCARPPTEPLAGPPASAQGWLQFRPPPPASPSPRPPACTRRPPVPRHRSPRAG